MTLLSILNKTATYFQGKGIEDAKFSAEWLLAYVLKCKRLDLYLRFEEPLSEDVLIQLRPLVKRRGAREPLQYILGEAPFGDLMLEVESGVLIPRPETEELCEHVIKISKEKSFKRILDLGTGSGVIAIFLAKYFPEAQVVAVDVNEKALAIARKNIEKYKLEDRITLIKSSWLEQIAGIFDLIVSNPPYLTDDEWQTAAPEVRDYEPHSALVPSANDPEGADDLITILKDSKRFLNKEGLLVMETGVAQHALLADEAKEIGYKAWQSIEDLSGRERFFEARA